jgi:hypothetical protein
MKLFMMCGRVSGWDDDLAMLVAAEDDAEACAKFRRELLDIDGSQCPPDCEEPELYIHQTDLVGAIMPDGKVQTSFGVSPAPEPEPKHFTVQITESSQYQVDILWPTREGVEDEARRLLVEGGKDAFLTDCNELSIKVHE